MPTVVASAGAGRTAARPVAIRGAPARPAASAVDTWAVTPPAAVPSSDPTTTAPPVSTGTAAADDGVLHSATGATEPEAGDGGGGSSLWTKLLIANLAFLLVAGAVLVVDGRVFGPRPRKAIRRQLRRGY